MASNGLVDLFVVGARTIITASRIKEINKRGDQQVTEMVARSRFKVQIRKEKKESKQCVKFSDTPITPESSSCKSIVDFPSDNTTKPVIWVKIKKKITSTVPRMLDALSRDDGSSLGAGLRRNTQSVTSSSVVGTAIKNEILTDAFDTFLQENLKLMEEIQTAKRRCLHNRQISRTLDNEENIYWTSNAPRPSQLVVPKLRSQFHYKAKKKGKRKKVGKVEDIKNTIFPNSIQGVCININFLPIRSKQRLSSVMKRTKQIDKISGGVIEPSLTRSISTVNDYVTSEISFPFQLQDKKPLNKKKRKVFLKQFFKYFYKKGPFFMID